MAISLPSHSRFDFLFIKSCRVLGGQVDELDEPGPRGLERVGAAVRRHVRLPRHRPRHVDLRRHRTLSLLSPFTLLV